MYREVDYDKDVSIPFKEFIETNRKTVRESVPSLPVKERPWYPVAIKYTKFSLWTLVIPLIYLIYKFLYWLFFFLGWVWYWISCGVSNIVWTDVLIVTLVSLSILCIFLLLIVGIRYFATYLVDTSEFPFKFCKTCQKVKIIFLWPFKTIGSIFSFFLESYSLI